MAGRCRRCPHRAATPKWRRPEGGPGGGRPAGRRARATVPAAAAGRRGPAAAAAAAAVPLPWWQGRPGQRRGGGGGGVAGDQVLVLARAHPAPIHCFCVRRRPWGRRDRGVERGAGRVVAEVHRSLPAEICEIGAGRPARRCRWPEEGVAAARMAPRWEKRRAHVPVSFQRVSRDWLASSYNGERLEQGYQFSQLRPWSPFCPLRFHSLRSFCVQHCAISTPECSQNEIKIQLRPTRTAN